ncbi:HDOD domain-containing protein [Nannocystis exedens]|uniref:HDOD domain-containing protein n=1 Tax=Nannocystis exedens TaxID=54 RepID=UPI000BBA004D|nr:HDOD domain-containing protein [Nannocystis exedens]
MACAGYGKWLANGTGADAGDAWLSGMVLRLGELLIYQVAPTAFAEIEQLPHLPGARWEREQRLLGRSEGQFTAELCRRWNFPKRIADAVERSSGPMAALPFCKLAGVVHRHRRHPAARCRRRTRPWHGRDARTLPVSRVVRRGGPIAPGRRGSAGPAPHELTRLYPFLLDQDFFLPL